MRTITGVPNIGPRQRRIRRLTGAASIVLGAALLAALLILDAPRLLRLTLVIPFWIGVLGILQDREKT